MPRRATHSTSCTRSAPFDTCRRSSIFLRPGRFRIIGDEGVYILRSIFYIPTRQRSTNVGTKLSVMRYALWHRPRASPLTLCLSIIAIRIARCLMYIAKAIYRNLTVDLTAGAGAGRALDLELRPQAQAQASASGTMHSLRLRTNRYLWGREHRKQ